MKLSTSRAGAARAAADRHARRLDAQRRAGALRRADRRRATAASSCAPPTWRSACASRSRPRSSAPGTVVLPARLLLDVVRSLPGRRRRRSSCAPPSRTSRSSPAPRRFHLRTLRAEDFPPLPEPGGDDASSSVPAPGVRRDGRHASRARPRATRRARSSPASWSPRPAQELRMVATDSYRLSVKETALEAPLAGGFEANVPARALAGARPASSSDDADDDPHRRARQPGRLRGRRRRRSRRG